MKELKTARDVLMSPFVWIVFASALVFGLVEDSLAVFLIQYYGGLILLKVFKVI